MFLVKKIVFFFQLSSQKKCGNTLELLNEHKKEMLPRGSCDFIFLEMGKIFYPYFVNFDYNLIVY
jgi:hypothetical protein